MPANLLAILAAAAVVIFYDNTPGVRDSLSSWWMPSLAGTAFVGALLVMAQAAPKDGVAPTGPVDEHEAERILRVSGYAGVIALAAIAFLLAIWWPFWALALLVLGAAWVIVWWPPALRVHNITSEASIARDPAAVFEFVSDLENDPRWWTMCEVAEKLTPGPIGRGSQFRMRARMPASAGRPEYLYEGVEEIVDYVPSHRFATTVATGIHRNFAEVTFDPIPNGTLVTHRFQMVYSYATAVTGVIVMFGGSGERELRANRADAWTRAKQILEGTP
jgi:uncharacterized protein YndB with AHSA1/START domain